MIEAENAVGLYLSRCLAESELEYLKMFDRRIQIFNDYETAKKYVFSKYESDDEINLSLFRPNYTIMRDKSRRYNFYICSERVIAYGINWGMRIALQGVLQVSNYDVFETDTTEQAEYYARHGFAVMYEDSRLYYGGILYPGESVSLEEVLRYNGLSNCEDTMPKFFHLYG